MTHVPVQSSNLKSIAYDESQKRLHVRFLCNPCGASGNSGKFTTDALNGKRVPLPCAKCDGLGHAEYGYPDVPKETHEAFMKAPSPGQFFAANIRGKFEGKRI